MKRLICIISISFIAFSSCVNNGEVRRDRVKRPKLVVGLVVDQMRWDYLYRFYDLYGNDGFKRLLKDGFNCQNTMVNYLPANTAPGHSCIYTGSVPSIHGIAGNNWIDENGKKWYCVDDPNVKSVLGISSMSPSTLLTTTITDELRLATNFQSRVFGVAIKDRGSILPSGHLGNAAYFYNDSLGVFTTTTYYAKPFQNPDWLQAFNKRKVVDSLTKLNWKPLLAQKEYNQSVDYSAYYGKICKAEKVASFPHMVDTFNDANRFSALKTMPAGNTYTLMMAKACRDGEKLGQGDNTDFLAISLSSTDYAGHTYAPNSMEVEDMYLRLDREIAELLKYLDETEGRNNYLLFLTADHAAAHNAIFLKDRDVPAEVVGFSGKVPDLNYYLKEQLHLDSFTRYVQDIINYQVFLDNNLIKSTGADRQHIKDLVMDWLKTQSGIAYVMDMENISKSAVPEPIRSMAINGYNRRRSGCIQYVMDPGWYDFGNANGITLTGTTHGSWNPYDTHIPLLWYGWGVPKGETHTVVNMTDISATLAAMLHIQMPNGCIGKPIVELIK